MTLESIGKLRELAADINSREIIDHMQLYPSCVFDGEWLDAWHRSFDKELEAFEREIAESYMRLPVDADGVPIRVGDKLKRPIKDKRSIYVVESLKFDGKTWWYGVDNTDFYACDCSSHAKRTIEDVLHEFRYRVFVDGEEEREITAKYADELRGMMGVE